MSTVVINGEFLEEPIVIDMGAPRAHNIKERKIWIANWLDKAAAEKITRIQKRTGNREFSFNRYINDLIKKDVGYEENLTKEK